MIPYMILTSPYNLKGGKDFSSLHQNRMFRLAGVVPTRDYGKVINSIEHLERVSLIRTEASQVKCDV